MEKLTLGQQLAAISVEKRLGGKTKEEISSYMKDVRAGKTPKQYTIKENKVKSK